jgi:putative ABC transport system permease protein
MTLFEMNSRRKEICVRKVLGASVSALLILLYKTNFRLMLIATVVAVPSIYFLTTEWLSNYPNRMTVGPSLVLIPLAIILAMVVLVSGIQTLRAAESNPVDQLRRE